jgi:DNA-binding CsgD family transcriptional regulator
MSFDSDPILELAGVASECRDRGEYERARLEWLERAVGFEASYFGAASPEQSLAPKVTGVDGGRVSRCEANAGRYWADRLSLQRAALESGGAVADHDALSARVRDRMPFYREVVSDHGIRASAIAMLTLRGRVTSCLFLGRTGRGARFGQELILLRRALPVLALSDAAHGGTPDLAAAAAAPMPFDSFGLTPREREVSRLVCQGWTNAQVAEELGTSPRTVKNQLSAILAKTGAANRTELTARFAAPRRSA